MNPQRNNACRRALLTASLAIVLAGTALCTAQAAVEADPTFLFPTEDPELQYVYWCHLLPDGKLFAGGNHAFRLNANGTRDTSFALVPAPYGYRKPVLEPGGGFTTFGTYYDYTLQRVIPFGRRFDANGAVDATFQPQWGPYADINLSARDARGGYLLFGQGLVPLVPGQGYNYALIRLLPNGSVDPAFMPLKDYYVSTWTPLPDGDWLLAAQDLTPDNDDLRYLLVRIRANGTIVSQHPFVTGDPTGLPLQRIQRLANGRVLIGSEGLLLAQVRSNGVLDPTFQAIWGEGPSDPAISGFVRLRNERTIVGSRALGSYVAHTREWPLPENEASWPHQALMRAMPDGMIDLSFDLSAALAPDDYFTVIDLAVQPDGRIVTATGAVLRRFREVDSPAVFAFGEKVVTVNENRWLAELTIYRTGDMDTRGSVTFATIEPDSTAIPGRDYWSLRQRIHFDRGVWKRTVFVPLRDDRVADGTKRVVVRLSQPDAASTVYSVDSAAIEILDNE